jgi:hypothetical protein
MMPILHSLSIHSTAKRSLFLELLLLLEHQPLVSHLLERSSLSVGLCHNPHNRVRHRNNTSGLLDGRT